MRLREPAVLPGLLVTGFVVALLLRVAVGGADVARSATAGLVFAGLLLAATAAARTRVPVTAQAVGYGAAGVVVLCVPVLLVWTPRVVTTAGFARWAAVVAVVAVAEELFLRGALYDALAEAAGADAAIAAGAVAFALLHVPLYGWHVVPLDLAVGVGLGELRRVAGTPAAPAVTHVGADLAAWFLR
jgi:membrane protease YdiL (CAAX protease family)